MTNLFSSPTSKIVIIGYGRFGQTYASLMLLHSKAEIIIISSKKNLRNKKLRLGSVDDIKKADVVIPCVPISQFEEVIKSIRSHLKKNALVIDVCSVKELPVSIMKKNLPSNVQIVASHPMFGPDSYRIKKKIDGFTLVLSNIRSNSQTFGQVTRFFKEMKLNVIELTPEKHDEYMAWSLGYSYIIGKIAERLEVKQTPIDTYDFQLLLENKKIVESDSDQLFFDMQTANPYAKHVRSEIFKTLHTIEKNITEFETKKSKKGGEKYVR